MSLLIFLYLLNLCFLHIDYQMSLLRSPVQFMATVRIVFYKVAVLCMSVL